MFEKERKKIDQIDKQLVKLIAKRIKIVKRIQRSKQLNHISLRNPQREKEIISIALKDAKKLGIPAKNLKKIFQELFKISKSR